MVTKHLECSRRNVYSASSVSIAVKGMLVCVASLPGRHAPSVVFSHDRSAARGAMAVLGVPVIAPGDSGGILDFSILVRMGTGKVLSRAGPGAVLVSFVAMRVLCLDPAFFYESLDVSGTSVNIVRFVSVFFDVSHVLAEDKSSV